MPPSTTKYVFTRDMVRKVDRITIESAGIPGIVLMENASRGLALHALHMLDWPRCLPDGKKVLIVCGSGNNGGDGFAAARHLHNAGVITTIITTQPFEKYHGDAMINLNICQAMGLTILEAADDPIAVLDKIAKHDLIIDGLLGTGLTNDVRPPLNEIIQWINAQPTPVLAIDIPSGLDCDNGVPLGCAVAADATVTFVGVKKGFTNPSAHDYTGDVIVTDIGVPRELVEQLGMPLKQ